MEFFEKLGQRIEAAWAATGHDEQALPAIAERALREAECHRHVDSDQVARWLMTAERIPGQGNVNNGFGEPALFAFNNGRLIIQLLHWVVGTTSLHEHGFFGAFSVLEGSSVHSRYQFTASHTHSEHFLIGELALQQFELLRQGDVRPITGRRLIHSLFHLDCPSISVVVRTVKHGSEGPQLNYLKPSIGLYPDLNDPLMARRLQYLKLLARTRPAEYQRWVLHLLERADLLSTFRLLQQLAEELPARAFWEAALAEARRRHGAVTATFQTVFEMQRRERAIVGLRDAVTDADHRFFLALLLVLPTRRAILEVIGQRFPNEEPRQKAAAWIADLGESLVMGVEFDELNRELLRLLVLGLDDDAVLGALRESFAWEDEGDRREELLSHVGRLRSHPIVAPLLQAEGRTSSQET